MIEYSSIPALIALIFKLVLLRYSARLSVTSVVTRLYLVLLVVLTLQNSVEFWFLNYYAKYGITATMQSGGFAYVALLILVGAIILHLSVTLSFAESPLPHGRLVPLLYGPAIVLDGLLIFTDKVIVGFKPFLSYSILRDPGPWYFLIEAYGLVYLVATLAALFYGARSSRAALLRMRNRLWLLGLAPMVLFLLYVVIVDYVGGFRLSAPVHLPVAITFFLIVTTYATHERARRGGFYRFFYRLFDVESYLPWSQAHRNKAALYNRIRTMVANIGRLRSVTDIVERLSEVLRCPVLLANKHSPVAALAGEATEMEHFPTDALAGIDTIVVAHEIIRSMPQTYTLMTRHKVAAIVPFHPRSRAASWMLLGNAFSEQVYTPADFDVVKTLFNCVADHLLDEQIRMRSELNAAEQEAQRLRQLLADATRRLNAIGGRLEADRAHRDEPQSAGDDVEMPDAELPRFPTTSKTLADYVADLERRMIAQALDRCGGNQAKAAEFLGLRPNTLHYKIQRYGLVDRKK